MASTADRHLIISNIWLADMVSQFAQNEQNMNAVERMLIYTELPSEGATHTPNDPPASWPEKGAIRFTDAELAYRQGLPLVLKGISLDIKPGEKVILSVNHEYHPIFADISLGWSSWSDWRRKELVDPGPFPVCSNLHFYESRYI